MAAHGRMAIGFILEQPKHVYNIDWIKVSKWAEKSVCAHGNGNSTGMGTKQLSICINTKYPNFEIELNMKKTILNNNSFNLTQNILCMYESHT